MKEVLNKTVKISGKTEVGLPFSETYFKPTPKFWRKLGDALIVVGSTIALFPFASIIKTP